MNENRQRQARKKNMFAEGATLAAGEVTRSQTDTDHLALLLCKMHALPVWACISTCIHISRQYAPYVHGVHMVHCGVVVPANVQSAAVVFSRHDKPTHTHTTGEITSASELHTAGLHYGFPSFTTCQLKVVGLHINIAYAVAFYFPPYIWAHTTWRVYIVSECNSYKTKAKCVQSHCRPDHSCLHWLLH